MKNAAGFPRGLLLGPLTILLLLAWGAIRPPAALAGWVPSNPWVLNPDNLNYPRVHHTATILANGQVLVVGGDEDNGSPPTVLAEVELYNPHSGTWSLTGNLNIAREYHTATLLSDGRVLVAGGVNRAGQCLVSVEIYNPAAETWTAPVASLNTARAEHTATLLPGGKILFVGGRNDAGQALQSAELYDLHSGTSQTIIPLQARKNHTATLLPGGKVLVVGGYDAKNQVLQTAEIFDPQSNSFKYTTDPCPHPHASHSATFLPSGSVMVAGGDDGQYRYSTNADLYDPGAGTWSSTDPLMTGSQHQTAIVLPDGRVLVAGGDQAENTFLDSTMFYDPNIIGYKWSGGPMLQRRRSFHTATLLASGKVLLVGGHGDKDSATTAEFSYPTTPQWTSSGTLQPRARHTATLLPSGKVLVAGGYPDSSGSYLFATSSAQIYDPSTGAWSNTGPLTMARAEHTATLLPGGLVLAAGGINEDNPISMLYLNSAELYDPGRGTWRRIRPMGQARSSHTATLLANGQVLVAGGINGSGYLASAELYNPATGTWSYTPPMHAARARHTATLLANGQVLVAGGENSGGFVDPAELYDPARGTWSQVPNPMITPHINHTATLLPDGRVLVAGSDVAPYNAAELYDPVSETWTQTASMLIARARHAATLLPSGLVLVTGSDKDIGDPTITEFYDPAAETWFQAPNMASARYNHTATLLNNGQVLVAGGYDAINGPIALSTSELFNANMGVIESWRPVITSVQFFNLRAVSRPGTKTADQGVSLGITLGELMNDFMQQMQTAQGTQVQLLSVQDGQSLDLLIDTSQSTPAFLVTQPFSAANDVYQVTICIGGIPSISFMIRIGPAVIPPCLSVTSCLQMLMN